MSPRLTPGGHSFWRVTGRSAPGAQTRGQTYSERPSEDWMDRYRATRLSAGTGWKGRLAPGTGGRVHLAASVQPPVPAPAMTVRRRQAWMGLGGGEMKIGPGRCSRRPETL